LPFSREDFHGLPTDSKDDLGSASALLSPFRGDHNPASAVDFPDD